jgi:quercetin dioxygenase-like cupin family protein
MTKMPDLPETINEILIQELAHKIDPADLSTLVFPLSRYQQFDSTLPTAVLTYVAGQIGVVVWNLEPGQENDYHLHPTSEHLHIVIEGQCEYTLGDQAPQTVRRGEAVMVPARVAHGIRNTTTQRASYVAIVSPGPYEKVRMQRPQ